MSKLRDFLHDERRRRQAVDDGDRLREFMVDPATGQMMYVSDNQLKEILRQIDGTTRGLPSNPSPLAEGTR
jgi:hypothetical protein